MGGKEGRCLLIFIFRGVKVKQKAFLGKLIAVDMYNCGTEEIATPVVAEEGLRRIRHAMPANHLLPRGGC